MQEVMKPYRQVVVFRDPTETNHTKLQYKLSRIAIREIGEVSDPEQFALLAQTEPSTLVVAKADEWQSAPERIRASFVEVERLPMIKKAKQYKQDLRRWLFTGQKPGQLFHEILFLAPRQR